MRGGGYVSGTLLTTDKAHSILIGYVDQGERTMKLPEKEYK
jgi:hypothetical protein